MSNQVVKVKRDTIASCMTCPLCNNLYNEATTISECLHTFCRKCIYDKITEEELECCPICNIDLGCSPLEKLRPDHSWQDVRSKIFPSKETKENAPEAEPSQPLPARRKERSLSSLVSTPRASTQSTMTGRRTKPTRKARALGKTILKEEDSEEDQPESSSSPDTSNKAAQTSKQNSSPRDASQSVPNKEKINGDDSKADLWKPLNCLVEIASRSKSFKSNLQSSDAKQEPAQINESDSQVQKSKIKDNRRKSKVEDEKTSTDVASTDAAKRRNNKSRKNRKKEPVRGESSISPQVVLDANSANVKERPAPIWFSLIAADDQDTDAPLPQIPPGYLRVQDGNMTVSYIQKYLVKKLNLASEDEVEIKCMGQPVIPELQLNNLVDMWLQTSSSSSHRISVTVGSSAKDFVMVLTYSRKAAPPAPPPSS